LSIYTLIVNTAIRVSGCATIVTLFRNWPKTLDCTMSCNSRI